MQTSENMANRFFAYSHSLTRIFAHSHELHPIVGVRCCAIQLGNIANKKHKLINNLFIITV